MGDNHGLRQQGPHGQSPADDRQSAELHTGGNVGRGGNIIKYPKNRWHPKVMLAIFRNFTTDGYYTAYNMGHDAGEDWRRVPA